MLEYSHLFSLLLIQKRREIFATAHSEILYLYFKYSCLIQFKFLSKYETKQTREQKKKVFEIFLQHTGITFGYLIIFVPHWEKEIDLDFVLLSRSVNGLWFRIKVVNRDYFSILCREEYGVMSISDFSLQVCMECQIISKTEIFHWQKKVFCAIKILVRLAPVESMPDKFNTL